MAFFQSIEIHFFNVVRPVAYCLDLGHWPVMAY
jgi:hypothetical protein